MGRAKSETSASQKDTLHVTGEAFTEAIREVDKSGRASWTPDTYWDLRRAGDALFEQIERACARFLRGDIDRDSFDADYLDDLRKYAFKVVPIYYAKLDEMAQALNLPQSDRIDTNHKNLLEALRSVLPALEYKRLLATWRVPER